MVAFSFYLKDTEMKETKAEKINSTKTVKVRFNVTMRNKSIPENAFNEARNEYISTFKEKMGTDYKTHPYEDNNIVLIVEAKYKQPYFFRIEEVHELPEDQANLYLDEGVDMIEDDKPRFFDDLSEVRRYTKKFHKAEIVG